MTARVIPFPLGRANRQPREHRSWCIDHSTDPDEPQWWGECAREHHAAGVDLVVTQDPEQVGPVVLVEPAGVHLTLVEAAELHAELGRLLAAVRPSEPPDPSGRPDTRRGA